MKRCPIAILSFRSLIIFSLSVFSSFGLADTVVGISAGIRDFNYSENLTSPLASNQSGVIPDIQLYSEQRSASRAWMGREKIEYAFGNLSYNGTTQEPNVTPVTSYDTHTFIIGEAIGGMRLFKVFRHYVYLYAGLNYRMWNRNLSNPAEVYNLVTVPVGLRFEPEEINPFRWPSTFLCALSFMARSQSTSPPRRDMIQ